jgi:two-component system, sensor histidine kinase LadS
MRRCCALLPGLALGLFLAVAVRAQSSLIVLPRVGSSVPVWGRATLLEDTTRQLTLAQVLTPAVAGRFRSTAGRSTQLGFSRSDFWLRVRVRTPDRQPLRGWVLHNLYLFADRLTFFLLDEQTGRVVAERHWGQSVPTPAWIIRYSEPVFPLPLEPGRTYMLLLRTSGNNAKVLNPTLWETHAFYQFALLNTQIQYLYLGSLLLTIVFQLIFFLFTKARNFILYFLYLASFLFVQVHIGNGLLGELYLWPENIWLKQHGVLLAVPLCIGCGMFFFANGLRLWDHSRWLFRLLQLDGAVALVLTAWVLADAETVNSTQHILTIALISNTLVVLACIVSLHKGFKPARYYLLATLSFLGGILSSLLWHKGLLPVNLLTNYAIDLGSLFEVIFFTLGLADDYRRTQRQERQAQQQLIGTLKAQNEQITSALLQGQTVERQRVAADLHDNLGATLSALQWTLSALDKRNLIPAERDLYQTLTQQLDQAYQDVRLLAHNLQPDQLAQHGLAGALTRFVGQINRANGVRFALTLPPDLPRLEARTEFELYSICLELCTNILKHANATEARISLTISNDEQLCLMVSDNGVGLPDALDQGRGLANIRARAEGLGGRWHLESGPGVMHRVVVPVRRLARAETQT